MLALSIKWAQRDSLAWEASITRLRLEAIQSLAKKPTDSFAEKSLFRTSPKIASSPATSSMRAALLWICHGQPLTNQISGWDQDPIRSNPIKIKSEIKFGSWLPQSLDSSKTSKKIRGNPPTIWKGSRRSTDLPILASQKLILASQQGYFPDLNRFDSICFHIFKGRLYPCSPYK